MPTSTKIGIQPQEKASPEAQRNAHHRSATGMPLQRYKTKSVCPFCNKQTDLGLIFVAKGVQNHARQQAIGLSP